jgi:hypothetical protein
MTKKAQGAADAAPAPVTTTPVAGIPGPETFAQVLEKARDQETLIASLEAKVSALTELVVKLTGAKAPTAPAAGPVRRAAPAEVNEPPRVLPTYKLLFVGQRRNAEGYMEPDLQVGTDGQGLIHVCGRAGSPIVFRGTAEDDRAHAMVHKSLGDWLIAEDCKRDSHGRPLAARYAWADPEAVAAAEPVGE